MTETTTSSEFTPEELGLALRNHGMHQEAVRYPITPIGMHYLLIHFESRTSTRRRTSLMWAGG